MHAILARRLVEKGAIREDTEFEAYYNGHGLSCQSDAKLLGRFRLRAAKISHDTAQVTFDAVHRDGPQAIAPAYRFSNDDIVSVDGMPAERLASIYNLNATGEDVAAGKRRGRKPRLPRPDL